MARRRYVRSRVRQPYIGCWIAGGTIYLLKKRVWSIKRGCKVRVKLRGWNFRDSGPGIYRRGDHA